jgi:hypothetical protein
VREYLEAQRRYRDLGEAEIEQLQREVDAGWDRLLEKSGSDPKRENRGLTPTI